MAGAAGECLIISIRSATSLARPGNAKLPGPLTPPANILAENDV